MIWSISRPFCLVWSTRLCKPERRSANAIMVFDAVVLWYHRITMGQAALSYPINSLTQSPIVVFRSYHVVAVGINIYPYYALRYLE